MRPDQMPRQPDEPNPGELEPYMVMTNAELASAISYAVSCSQGTMTGNADVRAVMLAHLKALTAVQVERAKRSVVTPNEH